MEKLFKHFCLGCVCAFAAVIAGNLAASFIAIDQMDQFFGCFIEIAEDDAKFLTPLMLFVGTLNVVINSHNRSTKEENT